MQVELQQRQSSKPKYIYSVKGWTIESSFHAALAKFKKHYIGPVFEMTSFKLRC
jgi:hypothetical protein